AYMLAAGDEVADQDHGGERGDDLEHEHHRVLDQRPRIELDEGRADRRNHDLGIEQRRDRHALADIRGFHGAAPDQFDANKVPAFIASCSTIGPSASAGKKVRPPMSTFTPTTRPMNRPRVAGKVRADGGTDSFSASEPAIAMAGMIIQKRPTSIATAPVRL